jgi:hypothetical protein
MQALAAWREHDIARAIHPADRAAIGATDSARTLVLELFSRSEGHARDLYNAGARLGRLLADAGASPSLAATTIDGAISALEATGVAIDDTLVAPLRASVAEGYLAGVVESERFAARRAWEYPACAVRLDRETAAIAASFPDADAEALGDWAARTALAASKDGVKTAVLSGPEAPRAELASAFSTIGIDVRTDLAPKSWLRLPWRK